MNSFEKIVIDYNNRFLKKIKNPNYIESNFFNNCNENFKQEINKVEYIDSKFLNLTSNINTTKNICIVDISLIFTYKLNNKIIVETYLLSVFSKNANKIFSYEKLIDKVVYDDNNLKLENLKITENIDVLSRKSAKYFHYNIEKEINFENINIVKNIITFVINQ